MHLYDYAFAAGWNVALGSLNNIEEHLGAYNLHPSGRKKPIGIRAVGVLDLYPVRTVMESGRTRGDGKPEYGWELILYSTAFTQLATYFTSAVSVKWTIYTRRHELGTYARYNCYASYPSAVEGDLAYVRQNILRAVLRFNDLVPSS